MNAQERKAAITKMANDNEAYVTAWRALGAKHAGKYALVDLVSERIGFCLPDGHIGFAQLNPYTGRAIILKGTVGGEHFEGADILVGDYNQLPVNFAEYDRIDFQAYCNEKADASEQAFKELLALAKERGADVE